MLFSDYIRLKKKKKCYFLIKKVNIVIEIITIGSFFVCYYDTLFILLVTTDAWGKTEKAEGVLPRNADQHCLATLGSVTSQSKLTLLGIVSTKMY